MSESNEAFVYFSSGSSGEKVNFDVLDKAGFVSNALGHNVCTDLRRTESDVNNSNHVSSEQKKEDDDRRQMVDLPDLQKQLLNIRVDVKRLSIPTRTANLRRTDSLSSDNPASNEMVTTRNRQKPADLVRRYCSKYKITVGVASISTTQICTKCGTLLDFQCIRCDKLYSIYLSLVYHLDSRCYRRNLNLKCPKCNYQTHMKNWLNKHLKYCTNGIIYSCSHCNFTTKYRSNLYAHMQKRHKDIYHTDCWKCRGEPNKCHQCKNTGLICENCHVGFGSNDRLQEHYESCKK